MAKWGYVLDNQVQELYDALPANWRNISNFSSLATEPELLTQLSWFPVINTTQPISNPWTETYGPTTFVYQANENIIWENQPVVPIPNAPTPEQIFQMQRDAFMQQLLSIRNQKLQDCDWTQLMDIQNQHDDTWKTTWGEYRAEVRNIITVYSNPPYETLIDINQVTWPAVPEV
jgi:hypothetical protein